MTEFWSKVEKTNGCWIWKGAKSDKGYGVFYDPIQKRTVRAHRFSWELCYGHIPTGLLGLHRCDNTSCVRPEHLFLGTQQDNLLDCVQKGRYTYQRGEQSNNAQLTWAQVRSIRSLVNTLRYRAIANLFSVSKSCVKQIATNRTWKESECPNL